MGFDPGYTRRSFAPHIRVSPLLHHNQLIELNLCNRPTCSSLQSMASRCGGLPILTTSQNSLAHNASHLHKEFYSLKLPEN